MDNIKRKDIKEALTIEKNFQQILQAGQGSGKSGEYMFSTSNKEFFLKTMTKRDFQSLRRMLPNYKEYLVD